MGFPLFLPLLVEYRELHGSVNLQGIVPISTDSRKKLCDVSVKIVELESTQGQSSTPLQLVLSNVAAIGDDQIECSCIAQIVVPCVRSLLIQRNWKRLVLDQGEQIWSSVRWGCSIFDRLIVNADEDCTCRVRADWRSFRYSARYENLGTDLDG
ncbi:hypothetical protein F0562_022613 [Nyssa sinensis]|uniref:Uncharacterized protein n=1 Tax=Nyssa sinensis TaxID=561372 RepID=A0A5J5BPK7_9ASTE|nr:hypothetical protein F0562_022613 [Nyssa sinensis]